LGIDAGPEDFERINRPRARARDHGILEILERVPDSCRLYTCRVLDSCGL
jgi:hypothetical protein